MINVFKIKKIAALAMAGLIPGIMFFIAVTFYSFILGLLFLFIGIVLMYFVANAMLKNPFTAMLEGKGILVLNIDSTGVIKPFLVNLLAPYIRGRFKGREVNDVWDREATFSLSAPVKGAGSAYTVKENYPTPDGKTVEIEKFVIKLNEEMYNKGRFALYHYPCILWNEQTNSLLTKDFFADKEKNSFAEHGVLYLNRKMEELTSAMLNFGRYVVEQLRPKTSLFANKWVWIIVVVLVVILIALFAPSIIKTITGAAGSAGGAIKGVTGGAVAGGGAINPVV